MKTINSAELAHMLERHGIDRSIGSLTDSYYFPLPTARRWRQEAVLGWLRGLDAARAAAASVDTEV